MEKQKSCCEGETINEEPPEKRRRTNRDSNETMVARRGSRRDWYHCQCCGRNWYYKMVSMDFQGECDSDLTLGRMLADCWVCDVCINNGELIVEKLRNKTKNDDIDNRETNPSLLRKIFNLDECVWLYFTLNCNEDNIKVCTKGVIFLFEYNLTVCNCVMMLFSLFF